jgi:pimeloyl-ACP methyl ester carboxylesterase
VPTLAETAPGAITERFDLVGFDPRGVGASTPTIDCVVDSEWDAERADLDLDDSPAGVDEAEAENRRHAELCVERSGGVEVLANMGTRDVARDVEVPRAALGDEKLTYLGYSYGTRIGVAYAEAFPQNVRAMVLDGAVDPTQTAEEDALEQAKGFQQAFEAYVADCVRQSDCPLGDDPARATGKLQDLFGPLVEEPLGVGSDRKLTYNDATLAVIAGLYSSEAWYVISEGLRRLADGDGEILLKIADLYLERRDDGTYGNGMDALGAVNCMDQERITDRGRQAELLRKADEVAPLWATDGFPIVPALGPCAFWPVPPTTTPHTPSVEGLPATLTVSVTGDPATPYQDGVDLARLLGGKLLSVEGEQHTVALQGDECVDDIVTAYLVDLRTPEGEARCTL